MFGEKLDAKEIKMRAKENEQQVTQFLRDIIAIPSFSGEEGKVIERISQEMKSVGFDEVFVDHMGSVVGRIGNGKTKILFDSHIDTVGIGDPNAWKVDPFKGKLENGIVYGRGASDNKAAIACMVYAGKIIKQLGLESDYTFYAAGIVQEEDCDGLAARSLIEDYGLRPDYVVLGECTNLDIYRGHRGRLEIIVRTKGKSCHASAPERGENAVYKMMPIVKGIEKLNAKLKKDKFLGKGSIAVTHIDCKTPSYNAVPDACSIYLDRRLTFGEDKELAVSQIKSLKDFGDAEIEIPVYDKPSYKGFVKKVEKYFPAWALDEKHVLVQNGLECAKAILDKEPGISKWVFGTDGSYTMGIAKIPTIGFGPGREEHSHSIEDQVQIEHLVISTAFYALLPQMFMR
ncbi:MAG: YgeY family selenium metabolism-linked hydrolase [Thermoplasmata archaeon]